MRFSVSSLLETSALLATSALAQDPSLNPNGQYSIVPKSPPAGAAAPVARNFASFSIEFAYFPDYAGNNSNPNTYSETLLNNIAALTGEKPVIRVGGQTQDYALLNGYMDTAFNNSVLVPTSANDVLQFSAPFFQSYNTFKNTKFIHGLNFARSSDGYRRNLDGVVIVACHALTTSKLFEWELGSEPDLYRKTPVTTNGNSGIVRPASWSESAYVNEWLNVTADIRSSVAIVCPDLAKDENFKFMAPSFAGAENGMDPWTAWQGGMEKSNLVKEFSSHHYVLSAPNIKLDVPATLLNHSFITSNLASQLALASKVSASGTPFILSETNLVARHGQTGVSNTFASALWYLDYSLWAASHNVTRIHIHQGTDFAGASWQPISTKAGKQATLPNYYAAMAVAAMTASTNGSQIIPLESRVNNLVSYAAYEGNRLKRVMIINNSPYASNSGSKRNSASYYFAAPLECTGNATVSRLSATGIDATTGISWDGATYTAENGGRQQKTNTPQEQVMVGKFGSFLLAVPDSSAAMVTLNCADMPKWED